MFSPSIPTAPFCLSGIEANAGGPNGPEQRDIEAENQELWRTLKEVYGGLRDLFVAREENEEDPDLIDGQLV